MLLCDFVINMSQLHVTMLFHVNVISCDYEGIKKFPSQSGKHNFSRPWKKFPNFPFFPLIFPDFPQIFLFPSDFP